MVASFDVNYHCFVELLDRDQVVVGSSSDCAGDILLTNPRLWWPNEMNDDVAFLHEMKVTVFLDPDNWDIYRMKVGIREVNLIAFTFLSVPIIFNPQSHVGDIY